MNNYNVNSVTKTAAFITTGLIASAMVFNQPALNAEGHQFNDFLLKAYVFSGPLPTYDQNRSLITHELINIEDPIVQTMSDVYKSLLYGQESLGEDFQKVLSDNLWDLYES